MKPLQSITLCCVLAVFAGSCRAPSARVRDPDEKSLVGDRRAGAVVYRNVIDAALRNLSEKYRARSAGQPVVQKIRVAFLGVDNSTNEELGAWRQQINDIVNISLNESGDFIDISFERFLKPALEQTGIRKESLALPAERRQLLEILEQWGNPIHAFLFARLSQGDTRSGNLKQSDYLLTLELMNASDGTRVLAHGELSKEYADRR